MSSSFADIAELARRADALLARGPLEGADSARLMALNDLVGQIRRKADAAQAPVAAELARQSRPELGADGLAKAQGYRNAATLIAATTGTTIGEAQRIVQVGEATAPRMQLSGVAAPARHPHVAAALKAGTIGAAAASAIIAMLDRVAMRAGLPAVDEAEKTLAAKAPGLSMNDLQRVIQRAEAWLDPDGVAPREDELRAQRQLHVYEDRSGMLIVNGKLDPERGAPVKAFLDAFVGAELRAAQHSPAPDAAPRTIPQLQADALAVLCSHALECRDADLPLGGATVVVRLSLDDLQHGTGSATIDGLAAPVSVATARRMAAGGGVIPCVLGSESEILDWGREKRLFTRAQRLALAERDGGCAFCNAPPGHCRAHHLNWWSRDGGRTDLDEGVLLCESCHHRIHDNGWEIRIDGRGARASVWFIPPPWVDPARTPRLGGRQRFDIAA